MNDEDHVVIPNEKRKSTVSTVNKIDIEQKPTHTHTWNGQEIL